MAKNDDKKGGGGRGRNGFRRRKRSIPKRANGNGARRKKAPLGVIQDPLAMVKEAVDTGHVDAIAKSIFYIPSLPTVIGGLLTGEGMRCSESDFLAKMNKATPEQIRRNVNYLNTELHNAIGKYMVADVIAQTSILGQAHPNPIMNFEIEAGKEFFTRKYFKDQEYPGFICANEKGTIYTNSYYERAGRIYGFTIVLAATDLSVKNDLYVQEYPDNLIPVLENGYEPERKKTHFRYGVQMNYTVIRVGDPFDQKLEIKEEDSDFVIRVKKAIKIIDVVFSYELSGHEKWEILEPFGIRQDNSEPLEGAFNKVSYISIDFEEKNARLRAEYTKRLKDLKDQTEDQIKDLRDLQNRTDKEIQKLRKENEELKKQLAALQD